MKVAKLEVTAIFDNVPEDCRATFEELIHEALGELYTFRVGVKDSGGYETVNLWTIETAISYDEREPK